MSTPEHHDDLPFEGLKVVDLSQGVAGPHCGMLLAQNGADVVKVEPPGGDWGRAIGAQYGDFCAYNIAFNRGKRSVALDLKSEAGLDAAKRLMAGTDVVVENYRPGVLRRFGLDYEALKTVNPDVVYVSVTGFGQAGPKSKLPATDSILQSFSGLMSVNRDQSGLPQRIGVLAIDVVTGLYAFQAVSTALYKRATKGGGRHISVSLMESIGAVQAGKMIEFHLEGAEGKKPGVPVATFETADGYMTINARRDSHFKSLCELLGCTELLGDPRFETAASRLQHEAAIMPVLIEKITSWTNAELDAALTQHDILHGAVNDYADYFADEHVRSVGAVSWLEHPGTGPIPIHRIPGLATPSSGLLARSPALGEHTEEVLCELGLHA
ncbi:MAG: CoA transferase [Gammaproteobacteria bacterium]|nr:CoA transferase [Gammaproteobacteria bacterium]